MRLTLFPVLLGSAVFLGAGFATTVLLPTADAANTTRTDSTPEYTVEQAKGRDIFARQGCVLCHTRQVRDTFSDATLAERPARAGDTLGDRPGLLGESRFGPDLSCVGSHSDGDTEDEKVESVVEFLRDPGGAMPSYGYLSDADLRRLAAYLVAQECPS